jgi:predicted RND superfamily exporter protein
VAPLILGLGVTAGVNAVHRWRQQPGDPPAGLAGGAGRAISMTLAMVIIGFACMMTAEHRGIRSLGLVMTLGLIMVWAGTVFLLPAVLRLRTTPPYDQAESRPGPRSRWRRSEPRSPAAAREPG